MSIERALRELADKLYEDTAHKAEIRIDVVPRHYVAVAREFVDQAHYVVTPLAHGTEERVDDVVRLRFHNPVVVTLRRTDERALMRAALLSYGATLSRELRFDRDCDSISAERTKTDITTLRSMVRRLREDGS